MPKIDKKMKRTTVGTGVTVNVKRTHGAGHAKDSTQHKLSTMKAINATDGCNFKHNNKAIQANPSISTVDHP